ncbi:MAG: hypothetical protein ABIV94_02855 [Acidimicrobiales bacterium]
MPVEPATVTIVLALVLALAVAGYLVIIAYLLRITSFKLGTVLIGVKSIEYQTRPLSDIVGGIGGDLAAIEGAMGGLAGAPQLTQGSPNGT